MPSEIPILPETKPDFMEKSSLRKAQSALISAPPPAAMEGEVCIDSDGADQVPVAIVSGDTPDASAEGSSEKIVLSKRAQNRLKRKAQMMEMKGEKRKMERDKKKQRRKQLAADGLLIPKKKRPDTQEILDIGLVMDLDFEGLMNDREIASLRQQISRCYHVNRHAEKTMTFINSSFSGSVEKQFHEFTMGHVGWTDVKFTGDHFMDLDIVKSKDKQNIIYLTADSPNTLTTLDAGKVYILGGLVDKNRHKGVCFEKAEKYGIGHAKLPIGEYIRMTSRHVLCTNHVFEIMSHVANGQTWSDAFINVIPQRKGVEAKGRLEAQLPALGDANDTNETEEPAGDASEKENEIHTSDEDENVEETI